MINTEKHRDRQYRDKNSFLFPPEELFERKYANIHKDLFLVVSTSLIVFRLKDCICNITNFLNFFFNQWIDLLSHKNNSKVVRPSMVSYPFKWALKISGSTWVIMSLCKPFFTGGPIFILQLLEESKMHQSYPSNLWLSAAAGKPVSFEISISVQSWATTDFCLNNDIELNWKLNKTPMLQDPPNFCNRLPK